jgi:hypothetical protein
MVLLLTLLFFLCCFIVETARSSPKHGLPKEPADLKPDGGKTHWPSGTGGSLY